MFKTRYHLCDVFGIPLYLDFSLIILLFFFVTGGGTLWSGIVSAALLLASITAHELGHALTARSFGCRTRDITLSLLGGCASLIALPRKASQEFLTAIAGPAVSFALSALGAFLLSLVTVGGGFVDTMGLVLEEALASFGIDVPLGSAVMVSEENMVLARTCLYLGVMNLMLGFFNMLPGFPMDGGRVFRSAIRPFMSRVRATYIAMVVGRGVAVLIAIRGLWTIFHGGDWGFVTLLIAWMIWREGYREYVVARMESVWDYEGDGTYRARVSPPPYGGDGDDCDVTRG